MYNFCFTHVYMTFSYEKVKKKKRLNFEKIECNNVKISFYTYLKES